eukprot:s340_g11.t1
MIEDASDHRDRRLPQRGDRPKYVLNADTGDYDNQGYDCVSDNVKGGILDLMPIEGARFIHSRWNLVDTCRPRDMARRAINNASCWQTLDRRRNNRDFVLGMVTKNWRDLRHASDRVRNDKEIARVCIRQDPQALQFVGEELKDGNFAGKIRRSCTWHTNRMSVLPSNMPAPPSSPRETLPWQPPE